MAASTQTQKKALAELRCRVENAIIDNYLVGKPNSTMSKVDRDISLWGIPLLPSKAHPSTDILLLKFLSSSNYSVPAAFTKLRRTLMWRRNFRVDDIIDEIHDLEDGSITNGGADRGGRPLCFDEGFNLIDESQEEREKWVRLKVQSIEKGIRKLSFTPGGVDSIVQVTDLKNASGMREIHAAAKQALMLVDAHYPELICRNIVINVPFWYYVFQSLFLYTASRKTRSSTVLARPSRVTHTLLKFIGPENIPAHYGGLWREDDGVFSEDDKVFEAAPSGSTFRRINIPITEAGVVVVWEVVAVGGEVGYKEEFIPDDECSYTISIRNAKKVKGSMRNSFYIGEPGRLVITINNKKMLAGRRVFYRFKAKPFVPKYVYLKS